MHPVCRFYASFQCTFHPLHSFLSRTFFQFCTIRQRKTHVKSSCHHSIDRSFSLFNIRIYYWIQIAIFFNFHRQHIHGQARTPRAVEGVKSIFKNNIFDRSRYSCKASSMFSNCLEPDRDNWLWIHFCSENFHLRSCAVQTRRFSLFYIELILTHPLPPPPLPPL